MPTQVFPDKKDNEAQLRKMQLLKLYRVLKMILGLETLLAEIKTSNPLAILLAWTVRLLTYTVFTSFFIEAVRRHEHFNFAITSMTDETKKLPPHDRPDQGFYRLDPAHKTRFFPKTLPSPVIMALPNPVFIRVSFNFLI